MFNLFPNRLPSQTTHDFSSENFPGRGMLKTRRRKHNLLPSLHALYICQYMNFLQLLIFAKSGDEQQFSM
jgi:hypothetical protein